MKQLILILLTALGFASCMGEAYEDCPGYMIFTFTHEGSSGGYDERIGNDVHLRIYKDNVLYSAGTIPYDKIKGGQQYLVQKEFTGEVDIVAWAVPSQEEFVAPIPTIAQDRTRTGELLAMKPLSRAVTYESMGHLYLGTQSKEEEHLLSDSHYRVSMNACIAQFSASIHNVPDVYTPGQDESVWMYIYGTKSEMDTDFTPRGEDAIVVAEFSEKEENEVLRTPKQGLLASAPHQYIQVDIYKGDEFQGTLKTDIQARPGDIIHLDIYRNSVTIHVNDWRIYNLSIQWI